MAVNPKLRWAILHRDNYACRYCGAHAGVGAVLQIDHVEPRARGGKDIARNLVAACETCNSGKSDTPLRAPRVEDVPQEAFRRACAERGVAGVDLVAIDAEISEDVATEIVGYIRGEEREQLLEEAREWIQAIAEVDPTHEEIVAQAAKLAYFRADNDLMQLVEVVKDFLLMQDLDLTDAAYAETDQHYRDNQSSDPQSRESRYIASVGTRFLAARDEEVLAALSPDERSEWIEFGVALFENPDWPLNDSDKTRFAARAVRATRADRHFPVMCRARGTHIPACPHRAAHLVRLEQCPACAEANDPAHRGHEFCEEHLQLIVEKKYVTNRGSTLVALDYTDLSVSA